MIQKHLKDESNHTKRATKVNLMESLSQLRAHSTRATIQSVTKVTGIKNKNLRKYAQKSKGNGNFYAEHRKKISHVMCDLKKLARQFIEKKASLDEIENNFGELKNILEIV